MRDGRHRRRAQPRERARPRDRARPSLEQPPTADEKTRNRTLAQSDPPTAPCTPLDKFWPGAARARKQCRLSIDNPFAMNANALPLEVAVVRPAGILGFVARGGSFRVVTRLGHRCCSPGWLAGSGASRRAWKVEHEGLGPMTVATVEHETKPCERVRRRAGASLAPRAIPGGRVHGTLRGILPEATIGARMASRRCRTVLDRDAQSMR